ncbi:hypothetical protein ACLESD_17640 [Pyxidicoccus sp. 3LFB2]
MAAYEAAEQDFEPSGASVSVFAVTSDQERLETAVALCDISPRWPKDFDFVEFDEQDLAAVGAVSPVSSEGETRCGLVNRRHFDVLLNGEQRRQLIERIAEKLKAAGQPTVPRYRRKDIEKAVAASKYAWLSPNSPLRASA